MERNSAPTANGLKGGRKKPPYKKEALPLRKPAGDTASETDLIIECFHSDLGESFLLPILTNSV